MFVSGNQANEIANFLSLHIIQKGGMLPGFVINEHDHPNYGRIIVIFSPFMESFAVARDGHKISPEEM